MTDATDTVLPIVDYFVLDAEQPHLQAHVCDACHARYLERRNGCGRCGGQSFSLRPVPTAGTLKAYTVVWRGEPGVTVPFVSCLVDLGDGLIVKSNLTGIDPTSTDSSMLGRPVDLVTRDLGTDTNGTAARTFTFELREVNR